MNRRKFLTRTGVVALGTSAAAISGGLFSLNSLAAEKIGAKANITLLKLARDIYPHDTLQDKYYSQVMTPMATSAETDKALLTLLSDGVKTLDNTSLKLFGLKYVKIKEESDRVIVLKEIEASPFFQKIKGALMMGIYNNPELWPRFGFGGSAWQKGGYINRGYDEIDWV